MEFGQGRPRSQLEQKELGMKHAIALVLLVFGTKAVALESIGTVTARLGGADLSWDVLQSDDGAAMVLVNDIDPLTMIDRQAMGDGEVYVGLIFQGEPATDVPPAGIMTDIRPQGAAGPAWKSDGGTSAAQLRIKRLELDGAGRMEASFTAVLCQSDAPTNCESIEGRIDTDLGTP